MDWFHKDWMSMSKNEKLEYIRYRLNQLTDQLTQLQLDTESLLVELGFQRNATPPRRFIRKS